MNRKVASISSAALVVLMAGCSGGSSAGHAPARRAAAHVTVASSISDGAALSAPTTWVATVNGVPTGQHVSEVEFLIDGKKSWSSEFSPYTFNLDGYAFWPWVMGTGPHVLTTRVTTSGGLTGASTAHVTVTGQPKLLPASLDGTYRRDVTTADLRRTSINQAPDRPPAGSFTLQIRKGLFVWEASGYGANEVAVSTGPHVLEFKTTANWLVPKGDVGGFCETPEASARYTWSVSGNRLILRPASPDDCTNRDSVATGTWTSTG